MTESTNGNDDNSELLEMAACYADDTDPGDGGYSSRNIDGAQISLPLPPLSLIEPPETTASQMVAMDEFMKSPNQDKWLELVEMMRREREERLILYQTNNGGTPPRPGGLPVINGMPSHISSSPRQKSSRCPRNSRSPLKCSRKSVQWIENDLDSKETRPDPPIDEDNDAMGGWTMHAIATSTSEDEDEEVSAQLKSILNHPSICTNDYDEGEGEGERNMYSQINSGHSSCSNRLRTQKSTILTFSVGFLLGTILIVGLSFSFNRTPAEELKNIALRSHGKGQQIGDSRDESGEEWEDVLLEEFCDSCQWKNTQFSCHYRVYWQMRQYNITEIEAKKANLKHCSPPVEEKDEVKGLVAAIP